MNGMRLSVVLDKPELDALALMAKAGCRQPREQLRYLVREAAKQQGLIREEQIPALYPEGGVQTNDANSN